MNLSVKGFYSPICRRFPRAQTEDTPFQQSMSNLDIHPCWSTEKQFSRDGYLSIPWLLKHTQNNQFHMLPRILVENLKACNIGGNETHIEDDGRKVVVDPNYRVPLLAGLKPLLYNDEKYVRYHVDRNQEGSTSIWSLFKSLRGLTGCFEHGGLSLAIAESTARDNMVSNSQLLGLPTSIPTEDALGDKASSRGDAPETGVNEGALMKKVSNEGGVMISCRKQGETSGELEVVMAKLLNKDSIVTANTPNLVPRSGETEIYVSEHGEFPEEIPAPIEFSYITGNREMSLDIVNPEEAPPRVTLLRLEELRQDLEANPIPRGYKQLTSNNFQQSAPMDLPGQRSQPAQHLYYMYTYSMTQGVGRTLKGKDQREYRNKVLRLTGFIED